MKGYKEKFKAERTARSPSQYDFFSKRQQVHMHNTPGVRMTAKSSALASGQTEAQVEAASSDVESMTLVDVVQSGAYSAIPTTNEVKALIPTAMERQARRRIAHEVDRVALLQKRLELNNSVANLDASIANDSTIYPLADNMQRDIDGIDMNSVDADSSGLPSFLPVIAEQLSTESEATLGSLIETSDRPNSAPARRISSHSDDEELPTDPTLERVNSAATAFDPVEPETALEDAVRVPHIGRLPPSPLKDDLPPAPVLESIGSPMVVSPFFASDTLASILTQSVRSPNRSPKYKLQAPLDLEVPSTRLSTPDAMALDTVTEDEPIPDSMSALRDDSTPRLYDRAYFVRWSERSVLLQR